MPHDGVDILRENSQWTIVDGVIILIDELNWKIVKHLDEVRNKRGSKRSRGLTEHLRCSTINTSHNRQIESERSNLHVR